MATPDRVVVLSKEKTLAHFCDSLRPPVSTLEVPRPKESAWPLSRVQGTFGAGLRCLSDLRTAIENGSRAEERLTTPSSDSFWRRRRSEADRLEADLTTAALQRKQHSETAASRELLAVGLRAQVPAAAVASRGVTGGASSTPGTGLAGKGNSDPSAAVAEARAISESLRRTHEVMEQSLGQASVARGALEDDGVAFRSTFDRHKTIGQKVNKAGKVLRKIQRQDEIDRWLMVAATMVFALTVLSVVLPRLPGLSTIGSVSSVLGSAFIRTFDGVNIDDKPLASDTGPSGFGISRGVAEIQSELAESRENMFAVEVDHSSSIGPGAGVLVEEKNWSAFVYDSDSQCKGGSNESEARGNDQASSDIDQEEKGKEKCETGGLILAPRADHRRILHDEGGANAAPNRESEIDDDDDDEKHTLDSGDHDEPDIESATETRQGRGSEELFISQQEVSLDSRKTAEVYVGDGDDNEHSVESAIASSGVKQGATSRDDAKETTKYESAIDEESIYTEPDMDATLDGQESRKVKTEPAVLGDLAVVDLDDSSISPAIAADTEVDIGISGP